MTEKSYKPPKHSAGDAAHAVTKAAIASVPYVGNAAVELFQAVFGAPIEKRKIAWMEDVAEAIRKLEAAGKAIAEDLASNEVFLDTMMQASQAAVRTSQKDKRDALRNAVLNAALPHAPDESRQQIFLSWVESLTVWHLRMLKLFADPLAWYRANNRQPPQYHITSSLSGLLTNAYPELGKEDRLCDKLAKDLYNAGLIGSDSIRVNMSASGAFDKRATELGNQFLQFITDPMTE